MAMSQVSVGIVTPRFASGGVVGGVIGGVPMAQEAPAPAPVPSVRKALRDEAKAAAKVDPSLTKAKGSIRVLVVMASTDAQALEQLRLAGARVMAKQAAGKLLVRVDASKLAALARLDAVLWIGPAV
jgi:hypothetical protein